jgi:hypothetical protein
MFKLKACVNITLLLERISRLGIHLYDVFKQHLIMNPYAFLTASCREFTLLSWSKIRMRKYINSPYLEKIDLARGVQPAFVAQVLIISLCFHSSFTQFCYQPSYCKPYILGQVVTSFSCDIPSPLILCTGETPCYVLVVKPRCLSNLIRAMYMTYLAGSASSVQVRNILSM